MRILLFVILMPFFPVAQITIKGKVIDKTTNAAVPYATIGLAKANKGTNADENGAFTITSLIKGDTMIISSVGYQTKRYALADWNDTIIRLEQKPALKPVIITSKKNWEFSELNHFSKNGNWTLTTTGYQTQVAQFLQTPKENCILQEVKIQKGYILFDGRHPCIFRLRFYDIDSSTGKPGEDLYNEVIEVKGGSKIITVDLKEYSIVIPHKDFFVAVEWLTIPYNENKPGPKEIIKQTTYYPSIMMSKEENSNSVWMLTYQYHWSPFKDARAHISATVKY